MPKLIRAAAPLETHPRTRPGSGFRAAPDPVRCWAVVYRGGWGFAGRCAYRIAEGDLCARHHARASAGLHVKRVKRDVPAELVQADKENA